MNLYLPVQNLLQVADIETGGLCWIIFFKWEDVDQWPQPDPETGLLHTDLILKPGAKFYACHTGHADREFKETGKYDDAGPYTEMQVSGTLAGNNLNYISGVAAMPYHQFGVLFKERDGIQRLLGNEDRGCRFDWDYTSGNLNTSRIRNLKFTWEYAMSAPVYTGGSIVADGQIIDIITNQPATTGNIKMLTQFTVGEVGAPMQHGNTDFVHPELTGKDVIVFVNSSYLPKKPDAFQRHIIKSRANNYITFVGGVNQGEIISIYTL